MTQLQRFAAALTASAAFSPATSTSAAFPLLETKVEVRQQPNRSETANIILSPNDVKQLSNDFSEFRMANAQNINALSMHVTQLAASVAALQARSFTESEDAVDRKPQLDVSFAALNANDLVALDQRELGDLLNNAADVEYFPSNALTASRSLLGAKDPMIRIGSVRMLVLGGNAKDKELAKATIQKEQNTFAKKMMQSALEANAR